MNKRAEEARASGPLRENVDHDLGYLFHGSEPITLGRAANLYYRMAFYRCGVDFNHSFEAGAPSRLSRAVRNQKQ